MVALWWVHSGAKGKLGYWGMHRWAILNLACLLSVHILGQFGQFIYPRHELFAGLILLKPLLIKSKFLIRLIALSPFCRSPSWICLPVFATCVLRCWLSTFVLLGCRGGHWQVFLRLPGCITSSAKTTRVLALLLLLNMNQVSLSWRVISLVWLSWVWLFVLGLGEGHMINLNSLATVFFGVSMLWRNFSFISRWCSLVQMRLLLA
jgi:hypothetical protein